MFRQLRIAIITAVLLFIPVSIFASSFVIQHIQVQGLQRIHASTVMHAMPLHVGQTYTDAEGNQIIAALFKTGFFSNVALSRTGTTLIVHVVERPTIDSVLITGNKSIKARELKPV